MDGKADGFIEMFHDTCGGGKIIVDSADEALLCLRCGCKKRIGLLQRQNFVLALSRLAACTGEKEHIVYNFAKNILLVPLKSENASPTSAEDLSSSSELSSDEDEESSLSSDAFSDESPSGFGASDSA